MAEVTAALCRHGQYEQPEGVPSAHLLHPLTEEGREASRVLANELLELAQARSLKLDPVIDSSPLLRAYETAAILAERLSSLTGNHFRIEEFDSLSERCLGAAANLTVREIERILERDPRYSAPPSGWKASADYRLPFIGAESMLEAGARIARHLRTRTDTLRRERQGAVLKIFVGHGGGIRHGAACLGALPLAQVPNYSMHYAKPVCLRAEGTRPWRLVAGAWKERRKAPDHDDAPTVEAID